MSLPQLQMTINLFVDRIKFLDHLSEKEVSNVWEMEYKTRQCIRRLLQGSDTTDGGTSAKDEKAAKLSAVDIKKEYKALLNRASSRFLNSPILLIQSAFFHFEIMPMNFIAYGFLWDLHQMHSLRMDFKFVTYRLSKQAEGRILQAEVRPNE